jgi:uncharacterized protein (DUF1778 family)
MKRLTGNYLESTTLGEVVNQDIQEIEHTRLVLLTSVDQEAFFKAMIAPVKPNAALTGAFAKARKILATN